MMDMMFEEEGGELIVNLYPPASFSAAAATFQNAAVATPNIGLDHLIPVIFERDIMNSRASQGLGRACSSCYRAAAY